MQRELDVFWPRREAQVCVLRKLGEREREELSTDDRWFLFRKMREMGESAWVDPLFCT